jgi:hypothetical protein
MGRNRAKCRLCNQVIESFTMSDLVECSCGEIAIEGGTYRLNTWFKNAENFLRIDDDGNEIPIKFVEKKNENQLLDDWMKDKTSPDLKNLEKAEILEMSLKEMIKNYNSLPTEVLSKPITGYDFLSLLIWLGSVFDVD